MRYLTKIFKHPIGIGVTTAVLSTIISTPIVAYVKSQSFTDAFMSIFKWVAGLIRDILTFGVPVWVILLGTLLYFKLIKPIGNAITKSSEPLFMSYTTDTIDDIQWEWEWYEYLGKYNISSGIGAFCVRCSGTLVGTSDYYGPNKLECENCGFKKNINEHDHDQYVEKIKREIKRRARIKFKEGSH